MRINKQSGFSLIELIIAAALGVGLTIAVIAIVISSNRSNTIADGISQSQETGRFVISYLNSSLRQAGFTADPDRDLLPISPVICVQNSGSMVDPSCTLDSITADVGDRITILREAGDNPESCAGADLALGADTVIADSFWIETDPDNNNDLRCVTRIFDINNNTSTPIAGITEQPIARGIVGLHALYGHSSSEHITGARNVSRYVSLADLAEIYGNDANNIDWQRVQAIRIAVLTEPTAPNTRADATRNYILLDSPSYTRTDRRLRQVFSTTVTMLNY